MDIEWAELASSLNEIGPPKSVEQWKKVILNNKIYMFIFSPFFSFTFYSLMLLLFVVV